MKNDPKKPIYKFESNFSLKNDKIHQEITNIINKNNLLENDKIEFSSNQIVKIRNRVNNINEYAVILNNSYKYESNVLICPLIDEMSENFKKSYSLSIGLLPFISIDKMFYADILKIRFIEKNNIIIDDKFLNIGYGKLFDSIYNSIILSYKALLDITLNKTYRVIHPKYVI